MQGRKRYEVDKLDKGFQVNLASHLSPYVLHPAYAGVGPRAMVIHTGKHLKLLALRLASIRSVGK